MTGERESSRLHHVVFAVAPERYDIVARLFTELGFAFQPAELTELGLQIQLDWDRGIELISPIPGSNASVAGSVNEFLARHGDGVYTVVISVPAASEARAVAERYGATIRFEQKFEGEGSHLEEIDLSVFDLPLTLLDTNLP
jgi:4-hydroxyphenylpyruvate dioxygenase-like putative hemolysin